MKQVPVRSTLWFCALVLLASQTAELEGERRDACQGEKIVADLIQYTPSEEDQEDTGAVSTDNFLCLLYPGNRLNCSWSFLTLNDSELLVIISVCDGKKIVDSARRSLEERVGSAFLILGEYENFYVIFQFNVTLWDRWKFYSYTYDLEMLEVQSPPDNISAYIEGGALLVTWAPPHSRVPCEPSCFQYQLDLGNQEKPKELMDQLSYTEPNADPAQTYRVRMRSSKVEHSQDKSEWSVWSRTVTVEPTVAQLNKLLILAISLGLPMILLALLLLLRYQRVTQVLFPPIPGPPSKYKIFLEKNDTLDVLHPGGPAEPEEEEEVAVVEVTGGQNTGKSF